MIIKETFTLGEVELWSYKDLNQLVNIKLIKILNLKYGNIKIDSIEWEIKDYIKSGRHEYEFTATVFTPLMVL